MTNEEIKSLWSKAARYARYKGLQNDAEDFAQEACLAILRGRKAGLRLLLIDYLRQRYGDSRKRGPTPKFYEQCYWVHIDEPDEDRAPFHQPSGDIGRQPEFERGDFFSRIDLRGRQGPIFDLVVEEGLPEKEVAEMFGVTESRVSQQMSVIRKKTNDAILIQDTWDKYNDDKEYSKLEIDWICL